MKKPSFSKVLEYVANAVAGKAIGDLVEPIWPTRH